MKKLLKVKIGYENQRLDKFILKNFPDFSRSHIQKAIKEGAVKVNGIKSKPSYLLKKDDTVLVEIKPKKQQEIKPTKIDFKVVYEDADLIVIDKPPGLIVEPLPHKGTKNLVSGLLFYWKNKIIPEIVHRLDKDTSGLIMVAKNKKTKDFLQSQFKKKTVTKKYTTLIYGRIKDKEGFIEAPICRSKKDRTKMAIAPEGKGRGALTRFKVRQYLDNLTLLEVEPKTGRTHQIRVHLGSIGHPVVGDKIYGSSKIKSKLKRQFLHASFLKFKLPKINKTIEFQSELPRDLQQFLDTIKVNNLF